MKVGVKAALALSVRMCAGGPEHDASQTPTTAPATPTPDPTRRLIVVFDILLTPPAHRSHTATKGRP